jgi:hypothetical protein
MDFLNWDPAMQKSELLAALQAEIHRHDFSHFIDGPPSVAQGGQGSVVSGCPACKKRINLSQFLDHLANDAMPSLLDRLSSEQGGGKNGSAKLH